MAEKLKSFYFRHDENAANDIKLMALRSQLAMEGYGIYWFMVEQLSMAGGKMPLKMVPMLATVMGTTPDKALSVIKNYDLFVVDADGFFSERLNRELEQRGMLSEAGRVAGLKSAESRKLKALTGTTVERPLNGLSTDVQPEEKRREEDSIVEDRREQSLGDIQKTDFEIRREQFKNYVFDIGGLKFTQRMLDEFFNYWSEANRSKKPKMRFELEKTWEINRRFATWAGRAKDYQCHLTDAQKTIAHKRRDLATSMHPYKEKYSKDTLNGFYGYWSQPENKPKPERLRWELEEFWDLGQRLAQWAARNPKDQQVYSPLQGNPLPPR